MICRTAAMSRLFVSLLIAAICPLLVPASAAADFSTQFESGEGYMKDQDLDGQQGWSAGITDGSVVIAEHATDNQAIKITITFNFDALIETVATHAATVSLSEATITQQVKIDPMNEGGFGIATLTAGDTRTNLVDFRVNGDIYVNGADTNTNWVADTWKTVHMHLDFDTSKISVRYGDGPGWTVENQSFENAGALAKIALRADEAWFSGDTVIWYDDLAIVGVPEPGSLVLLTGGVLAALLRRRRA